MSNVLLSQVWNCVHCAWQKLDIPFSLLVEWVSMTDVFLWQNISCPIKKNQYVRWTALPGSNFNTAFITALFSCLLFMPPWSHSHLLQRLLAGSHTLNSRRITRAVKSNVWKPPLGPKMEDRLLCPPLNHTVCPQLAPTVYIKPESGGWIERGWESRCRIQLLSCIFQRAIRDFFLSDICKGAGRHEKALNTCITLMNCKC